MHKYFFTPLVITILALAIPTIAFEDDGIKLSIKYELNAELDELVLNFCNTYDSFTINKLYSEKDLGKVATGLAMNVPELRTARQHIARVAAVRHRHWAGARKHAARIGLAGCGCAVAGWDLCGACTCKRKQTIVPCAPGMQVASISMGHG